MALKFGIPKYQSYFIDINPSRKHSTTARVTRSKFEYYPYKILKNLSDENSTIHCGDGEREYELIQEFAEFRWFN